MTSRPAIPAKISRQILIEAGHRCAVCGVPCPLEKAHIIPWRESKEHRLEDLICLCANCHSRADKECWGEDTLREYKRRPWVLRQNEPPPSLSRNDRVRIEIDKDYDDFDKHSEDMLRHALASFLKVAPESVRIVLKRRGSVEVIVELQESDAARLVSEFLSENPKLRSCLAIFPILDIVPAPTSEASGAVVIRHPSSSSSHQGQYSDTQQVVQSEALAVASIAEVYEGKFQRFYSSYSLLVARFFEARGFSEEEVRDLTEETFVLFYKSLRIFSGRSTPGTAPARTRL